MIWNQERIEAACELRSACIVENGNWKRKTTIDVKKRSERWSSRCPRLAARRRDTPRLPS
jgi:hypothetical protein